MKPEAIPILSNERLCDGHFILRLKSKTISQSSSPGQFIQILTNDLKDPLLPRPFSFLDTNGSVFEILYQVVGRGTEIIASKKKGQKLMILGPLGNGWDSHATLSSYSKSKDSKIRILVGGGVGIPPLYHLAKKWITTKQIKDPKQIKVFLGGRDKQLLHCQDRFAKLKVDLSLSTDNGSRGYHGLVTDILNYYLKSLKPNQLQSHQMYTCGPTPMLKAVSQIANKAKIQCQVSVEEPMPCGFGVCLGCAIKVKSNGHQSSQSDDCRYAMSCTEGPVFHANQIMWD